MMSGTQVILKLCFKKSLVKVELPVLKFHVLPAVTFRHCFRKISMLFFIAK